MAKSLFTPAAAILDEDRESCGLFCEDETVETARVLELFEPETVTVANLTWEVGMECFLERARRDRMEEEVVRKLVCFDS